MDAGSPENRSNSSGPVAADAQVPDIAGTAVAFVIGIVAAQRLGLSGPAIFIMAGLLFVCAGWSTRQHRPTVTFAALLALVFLAGALRWNLAAIRSDSEPLRDLCRGRPATAVLTARISSVPIVHRRPSSALAPRMYGSDWQTRFAIDVQTVETVDGEVPVTGRCRVYIDGNAALSLTCDDLIRVTGTLDWPNPPGNPGEFDFPDYLSRHEIAALIYVNHPQAIENLQHAGPASFGYWLTSLRQGAQQILMRYPGGDVRSVAMALLLGDRNELSTEIETAFVSSGAMHLLAISGLHVGILCLFLMRVLHLLLVPWTRSLIIISMVCLIYALVTDLRPSVVRATVFFLLFVVGQLFRREVSTMSLLTMAALLMLSWQPQLVFDTGAWLSFLSVAALGWVSGRAETDSDREAPPDALTLQDRLRGVGRGLGKRLSLRYRQMLCILALTTPLVAAQFHVVSPVGLVINVLLIPFTALTLVLGFLLLFAGFLLPVVAPVLGFLFSHSLAAILFIVEMVSRWDLGHIYIADLPRWFVPAFYGLLFLTVAASSRPIRHIAGCSVLTIVAVAFGLNIQRPESTDARCTILDVGHGSATVVEPGDGRVLLVDAGAMNQGDRAADVICRFLWFRGYRRLNGIVVSHADMDHYNALGGVVRRMPVAELLLAQDFLHNEAPSARAVADLADEYSVPVRVITSGTTCNVCDTEMTLLQANLAALPLDVEDNQKSLLLLLRAAGRTICIPGDIEGEALRQLLPQVEAVDVLVSPHHGSTAANTSQLASVAQPKHVIVSARDAKARSFLTNVYSAAESILFTSEAGAVTVRVRSDGTLDVETFRDNSTSE